MNDEMFAALTPFHADEKSDCEQSRGCGDHDKKENQQAAEILLLGYLTYLVLRCRQNRQPIKRKDNCSDCIPTRNRCTPRAKMPPRDKEHRCTSGQSKDEAMPRVLPRNKIDKAHVSSWP